MYMPADTPLTVFRNRGGKRIQGNPTCGHCNPASSSDIVWHSFGLRLLKTGKSEGGSAFSMWNLAFVVGSAGSALLNQHIAGGE